MTIKTNIKIKIPNKGKNDKNRHLDLTDVQAKNLILFCLKSAKNLDK